MHTLVFFARQSVATVDGNKTLKWAHGVLGVSVISTVLLICTLVIRIVLSCRHPVNEESGSVFKSLDSP